MSRRKLQSIIKIVGMVYILFIIIGITLRVIDKTDQQIIYQTFKDLIPLIFAIPIGYLGFCFQRRSNFVNSLKLLWNHLIVSINEAVQYTHRDSNTKEEFGRVLVELSKVIDEIRGVYKNIGESESNIGLYPFEPIKNIRREIDKIGYGDLDREIRDKARKVIIQNWKSIRHEFLYELDRSEPAKPIAINSKLK